MFTIERATADDFGRVYPRLRQCFGETIPEQEWRKIFAPQWAGPEDFCGYMLLKDGQVKGYLGLIFSRRTLDGRPEKFCNLTSWCVSDDCRGQSLSMLLTALKLSDYTFTNFTASPTVAAVLSRLGFREFETHHRVVLPLPHLNFGARGCACVFEPEEIRARLGASDRAIFDDHRRLGCEHLLLSSGAGDCYVVLKKTWRKHLPFVKVHYLSRPEVFAACVERMAAKICLRLRVCGVMVDERYLRGRRLRRGISYPHQRRAYFKTNSDSLDAIQIDTLYSELVVLHN
ncbi:MAG TPA: hypothetical protein VGP08_12560 [Pyrinomonadaceae bacterium]|jgi:hypothetical protein|nr:hypothetical protein [Pyrinomonadaceae bacterium]